MIWEKCGRIFKPNGNIEWWKSHCHAPSALLLNERVIRVFLACWDSSGVSRVGYVDVDADNPSNILGISKKPVLDIGDPGTFDDNGVVPGGVVFFNNKIYLYYTGYQIGNKVRYFMFGGLAISVDGGESFYRVSKAPILDRSDEGLCTRAGATVIFENDMAKLWYPAGTEWLDVKGKKRPTYNIFYQESKDGINTNKTGIKCMVFDKDTEHGFGRPLVIKEFGLYRMFHTIRTLDMRYKIGYAESEDGINWIRKDAGISCSDEGWDSEMVYFPSVVKSKDKYFMFYTGNNFGETGFGYAELKSW